MFYQVSTNELVCFMCLSFELKMFLKQGKQKLTLKEGIFYLKNTFIVFIVLNDHFYVHLCILMFSKRVTWLQLQLN